MNKHKLICTPTFLRHVTGGEEPLLSVREFSHPPVVVVFVQHRDNIALEYRQLVRPLSSVIVHGHHLQNQTDKFNACPHIKGKYINKNICCYIFINILDWMMFICFLPVSDWLISQQVLGRRTELYHFLAARSLINTCTAYVL